MSPEIRKNDWEGIVWHSPRLGINKEYKYSLSYCFFPDEDFKRVQEVWFKGNGQVDTFHQEKGWHVGFCDAGQFENFELVVWDGDEIVSGIHRTHLKRIE